MYALYGEEQLILERVRSVIPGSEDGIATACWHDFQSLAPSADCLLVASRWLSRQLHVRLRNLSYGCAHAPLLLITTRDADNARAALNSGATSIVWLSEINRELNSILCTSRKNSVLSRAAAILEKSERLNPTLRKALVHACSVERPILSIRELANTCGCDRRTLWRHWQKATDTTRTLRLEDFLDWILILHAGFLRSHNRSWNHVALQLGTHEHTLARISARLTGSTLTTLMAVGHKELERRFFDTALSLLVSHADKQVLGETFGACPQPRNPTI